MAVAGFAQGVKSPSFSMVNHTNDGARAASTATKSGDITTAGKTSTGDDKSFFDNMLDIVNPLEHLPVVSTIYHAITGDKMGDVEKVAGDTLYGGPIGLVSSLADLAFEKITGKDFGDTVMGWVGIDTGDDKSSPTVMASNDKSTATDQAETAKTAALNNASLVPPAMKIAQAASFTPIIPAQTSITTPVLPDVTTDTTTVAATEPVATAAPKPISKLAAAQTSTQTPDPQNVVDISPNMDALLSSLQKNGMSGAMQAQALDAYRRTMALNAQQAQQAQTVH